MRSITKAAAALAFVLAGPTMVSAHGTNGHYAHGHHHHHHGADGTVHQGKAPAARSSSVVIRISCFRGPTNDIIWDKPNAVFVDSLVEAGYDFPTAHAIAYRVCRDPDTLNDTELMKRTMERILRDPASRRNGNLN